MELFLCNYMCIHNSDNNNSKTDDSDLGLEFSPLFLLFFFLFLGGSGEGGVVLCSMVINDFSNSSLLLFFWGGGWFCALWSLMILQIVACSFLLQSKILNKNQLCCMVMFLVTEQ